MSNDKLIQQINALPPWPQNLHELAARLDDEDVDVNELAERISIEQALVMRLLRVANSSFYNACGKVSSTTQAINVIGLRSTRSLVIAATVISQAPQNTLPEFDIRSFWSESYIVASVAKAMAAHLRMAENDVFTGGILHDIGKIIMANTFREKYFELLNTHAVDDEELMENECRLFGIDHAQVGATLAEKWDFPTRLVQMLREHHRPAVDSSTSVHIIHTADKIASYNRSGAQDDNSLEDDMEILNCSTFDWRRALKDANTNMEIITHFL